MNPIEVENLSFSYPGTEVLRDLSFQIEVGSFFAIAGPNGVGKSTLLNLICGILKADNGVVKIDGKEICKYSAESLARKVAVVRQEFVPVFGFSVAETVFMARTPYMAGASFESKTDERIVAESLEATETVEFSNRQLGQISGGERQRVFIARALAQDTPILLLDEPTSHLDLRHQIGIYDLLKEQQEKKGKTIIAITHDINLASQYCDKTLLLGPDRKYYIGEAKEIFSPERIEQVFGVSGFSGSVGDENFFLPLGKFAKDGGKT